MQPPKIKDVTALLESIAPRHLQESYDNSGLLAGDADDDVKGVLVTLDCTEAVVAEASQKGCNLIVAHHPIIFQGLKKLTGATYVERTVIAAIRNNIAIYAIHTNLDNVSEGVNKKIAERIGLVNTSILLPREFSLAKLVTFVPPDHLEKVLTAMHAAGAGQIGNYKDCSFMTTGKGRYTPGSGTHPFSGEVGKPEMAEEVRVEVVLPSHISHSVIEALRQSHPYEEVAFYLSSLENTDQQTGSGMIGELPQAEEPSEFLRRLKEAMQTSMIRHTPLLPGKIRRVAVCGGAGSFLLKTAIDRKADVFVSADFKYHEFFDAEGKIVIADVGHYESEQFTKDLLVEVLTKKFPTFAINFSSTITNPLRYL